MPIDDASNMFRFAVGLFYESRHMASALSELGNGAMHAEMCVVGAPAVVQQFAASSETVRSCVGKLKTLALGLPDLELVATDGQLLNTLLDHGKPPPDGADGTAATNSWLLPDLFGGLAEHLRRGAVALFVSAPDFGRQGRASRVLLRHTAHTVQTHEFTARRAGPSSPARTSEGDDEMPRT
jgi:hypothetical protein